MEGHDRLFVPLSSEPYRWFKSGQKKWELRRLGRQYTLKNVVIGRAVELRKGYSTKESLWGKVIDVKVFGSIKEVFETIEYKDVIPVARSSMEAVVISENILKVQKNSKYLCFRVLINSESSK
jgi:ASC-1-like (ASCH) protein